MRSRTSHAAKSGVGEHKARESESARRNLIQGGADGTTRQLKGRRSLGRHEAGTLHGPDQAREDASHACAIRWRDRKSLGTFMTTPPLI